MAIEYNVIPNALTSPPSYTARPTPKTILDFDTLADAINTHNPTIPIQTAKSVLESFREEVIFQLAEGNSINLTGFMSLVVSMPVRLDQPTDTLPPDPIDIKAKPSVKLKQEVRQAASYTRLAFVTKQPNIVLGFDTNSLIDNWVREGYGLRIDGSNIGFDGTDALQGVFITSSAGNEIKQDNISLNDPSKIITIPSLDPAAQPGGTADVEQTLAVKTKYTVNGQIRTGTYSRPLRGTVVVSDATASTILLANASPGISADVSSYLGAQVSCRFLAQIKPNGVLTLSVGTMAGVFGQEMEVMVAGDFVLAGLAADVTVTVVDYDILYAAVLSYNRYLNEVADLSPLTP